MAKRFILLILILTVAVCGVLGIEAFRIESLVQRYLSEGPALEGTLVYGAPPPVGLAAEHDSALLFRELARLGFTAVKNEPSRAGQFWPRENEVRVRLPRRTTRHGRTEPEETVVIRHGEEPPGGLSLPAEKLFRFGADEVRTRATVPLQQVPKHVIESVIAIEDERFYEHAGVDLRGIARAAFANLKAGRLVQGGSTITQQLAKNLFFSPRRTLLRKIREALAALSLEWHLTKDEILELYLNEVYFGQEGSIALHGIRSAAASFFDKSVSSLNLAEGALLAALIQAPSYYSPRRHPKRIASRREIVLGKLLESGVITKGEFQKAAEAPVEVRKAKYFKRRAPYFFNQLRRELSEEVDLQRIDQGGFSIYTGLSVPMQSCAERAVQTELSRLEQAAPRLKRAEHPLQAGFIAIEPHSGLIRAWVGGRDYKQSQFDHASMAERQVGSTLKPFVYLTALDPNRNSYKAATARSLLADKPLTVRLPTGKTWSPENYDHEYRGLVTLRYALERSLNVPAAYVAQKVGARAIAETVKDFSIHPSPPPVPSISLGALDTTLLKLTSAYAALANYGVHIEPRFYVSIIDRNGTVVHQSSISERRLASEPVSYVLTNLLMGVIDRGTGKRARPDEFHSEMAGKTGTSQETRDVWFFSYTPTLAGGVWIGFDDNKPTGLAGGTAAAPVWRKFLECAEEYIPPSTFIVPRGVTFASLDAATGTLSSDECRGRRTIQEVYVKGTAPSARCRRTEPPPEISREFERPQRRRPERNLWDYLFGE